jgi:hypothetical protein
LRKPEKRFKLFLEAEKKLTENNQRTRKKNHTEGYNQNKEP